MFVAKISAHHSRTPGHSGSTPIADQKDSARQRTGQEGKAEKVEPCPGRRKTPEATRAHLDSQDAFFGDRRRNQLMGKTQTVALPHGWLGLKSVGANNTANQERCFSPPACHRWLGGLRAASERSSPSSITTSFAPSPKPQTPGAFMREAPAGRWLPGSPRVEPSGQYEEINRQSDAAANQPPAPIQLET